MKKITLGVSVLFSVFQLNAQTNLLVDGSFESLVAGYNKFITPSGGKVKGMSGKWQMAFAKGACPDGCAKGTAAIVSTEKKSGNNSIEIKIDSQVNRNDIKLLQSINGATPVGIYEVSFYVKASVVSPVAIDVLKSTQPNSNNGIVPFTGNFTATTDWQQFKFTVDISDWTDDDRTEMRISIRVNNNKALPAGPYPKTYWIDDVSFVKK
jgi:hypothetical protein